VRWRRRLWWVGERETESKEVTAPSAGRSRAVDVRACARQRARQSRKAVEAGGEKQQNVDRGRPGADRRKHQGRGGTEARPGPRGAEREGGSDTNRGGANPRREAVECGRREAENPGQRHGCVARGPAGSPGGRSAKRSQEGRVRRSRPRAVWGGQRGAATEQDGIGGQSAGSRPARHCTPGREEGNQVRRPWRAARGRRRQTETRTQRAGSKRWGKGRSQRTGHWRRQGGGQKARRSVSVRARRPSVQRRRRLSPARGADQQRYAGREAPERVQCQENGSGGTMNQAGKGTGRSPGRGRGTWRDAEKEAGQLVVAREAAGGGPVCSGTGEQGPSARSAARRPRRAVAIAGSGASANWAVAPSAQGKRLRTGVHKPNAAVTERRRWRADDARHGKRRQPRAGGASGGRSGPKNQTDSGGCPGMPGRSGEAPQRGEREAKAEEWETTVCECRQ